MQRWLSAFCALLLFLPAQAAPADAPALADCLRQEVARAERWGLEWAVRVDRLDTGETVFASRADLAQTPASNVKLFTTAAALVRLGPAFTTRTSVYADGVVADGVLEGDLVLYGRGDPNISGRFYDGDITAVFADLARQLSAAGIRHVQGDVVGDGTYFEDADFGPWQRADQHRWYAARVSALSFNDNCVDLFVGPGDARGARPALRWEPAYTRYVRVFLRAQTVGGARHRITYWRDPGSNTIGIGGSIGQRAGISAFSVAVDDPPAYAAWVFRDVLEREGITVSGEVRTRTRASAGGQPVYAREVAVHVSPPLSEVISVINKRSQNLHAELLLKTLGREAGHDGAWSEGLRVVRDTLCDLGVDDTGLHLVDGSGLGRENLATASALVTLLKGMAATEHADVFEASLVQVGEDPSLTDLAKTVRHGEIRAKSGTLKGVLALSGYVRTPTGAPLAFAFLGHDPSGGNSVHLRDVRDNMAYCLIRHAP